MLCAWRVRPVICLWQYDRYQCNSESKPGDFDHAQSEETDPQAIATTTDNRKLQYGFCSPISQFVIVGRCRNHLANLLSSWTSSKISNLALEFRRYLSEFHRCNYFRFWRPYRYVRLSLVVVITCRNYFPPRVVVGILTFHSFRDTSISDFGRRFRLSVIIGITQVHFLRVCHGRMP